MYDLTSKGFRKNNYYVLYDCFDNIVVYLDNCLELFHFVNLPLKELVRKFKRTNENYINVVIDNKKYKLYTFIKD